MAPAAEQKGVSANVSIRLLALAWALFSFVLACQHLTELSMLGFPDGYISPYDIETKLPMEVLSWLIAVQGACFLLLGLIGGNLRPGALLLQVSAAALFVVAPTGIVESCPRWDWCAQAYQQVTGTFLDDGSGG